MSDETPPTADAAASPPSGEAQLPPAKIAAVVALGSAVIFLGGPLCGWFMVEFAVYGNLTLLLLGIGAGFLSRTITGRAVPWIGWMLAAAVLLSFATADIVWLRYAEFVGDKGAKSWGEAIGMFFQLYNTARMHFIVGLICAGFGAHSAYWRAGSRWRTVMVKEE